MSNPNFPQDKLLDVFLDILKINPYNAEYHKFMISHFGENDETTAIKIISVIPILIIQESHNIKTNISFRLYFLIP